MYCYKLYMDTKHTAKWHNHMTDQERGELARATAVHSASSEQLRELKRRIKDRCIKRMRRAKDV